VPEEDRGSRSLALGLLQCGADQHSSDSATLPVGHDRHGPQGDDAVRVARAIGPLQDHRGQEALADDRPVQLRNERARRVAIPRSPEGIEKASLRVAGNAAMQTARTAATSAASPPRSCRHADGCARPPVGLSVGSGHPSCKDDRSDGGSRDLRGRTSARWPQNEITNRNDDSRNRMQTPSLTGSASRRGVRSERLESICLPPVVA